MDPMDLYDIWYDMASISNNLALYNKIQTRSFLMFRSGSR